MKEFNTCHEIMFHVNIHTSFYARKEDLVKVQQYIIGAKLFYRP